MRFLKGRRVEEGKGYFTSLKKANLRVWRVRVIVVFGSTFGVAIIAMIMSFDLLFVSDGNPFRNDPPYEGVKVAECPCSKWLLDWRVGSS